MKASLASVLLGIISVIVATLAGCAAPQASPNPRPDSGPASPSATSSVLVQESTAMSASNPEPRSYSKPSAEAIKQRLNPIQYRVTQQQGTEPPFQNEFWNNHEAGLYVDIVSGEPLFSSTDKFDSGTGWPSFTRPVGADRVVSREDASHGMVRVEARSKSADSHLGHVFNDGPAPAGTRYCINSAALRFIPAKDLARAGYGQYANLFETGGTPAAPAQNNFPTANSTACALPKPGETPGCQATMEVAILAGGCFWGMEEIIRQIPGVIDTEVGYTGGNTPHPAYQDVKTGRTGHAEAIKVTFDPSKLSYADLLEKWFFKMHDPTTPNRQGNDIGSQYRSAIFYTSEAQRKSAEDVKARVDKSGKWKQPVVTEIVKAGEFTSAEDYHQNYLQKNPGGYTCHYLRK